MNSVEAFKIPSVNNALSRKDQLGPSIKRSESLIRDILEIFSRIATFFASFKQADEIKLLERVVDRENKGISNCERKVSEVSKALRAARKDLTNAMSARVSVDELLHLSEGDLAAFAANRINPLREKVKTLEGQLSEAQKSLAAAKKRRSDSLEDVKLAKEIESERQHLGTLTEKLISVKKRAQDIWEELRQIEKEEKICRNRLDGATPALAAMVIDGDARLHQPSTSDL